MDIEKKFYKFWREWRDDLNNSNLNFTLSLISEQVLPIKIFKWFEMQHAKKIRDLKKTHKWRMSKMNKQIRDLSEKLDNTKMVEEIIGESTNDVKLHNKRMRDKFPELLRGSFKEGKALMND